MNKASKTFTSESLHRSDKNNYSGEMFYNSKVKQNHLLKHSQLVHGVKLSNSSYVQTIQSTIIDQNTINSFNPLTPNPRKIFHISHIKPSLSRHKENSALSCELQQISNGFNKENQRIQDYLYQIRQNSVKREKQRSLHLLNISLKNSKFTKHNQSLKQSKIHKKIDRNLILDLSKESKTGLKKKNLHQLMKQQKSWIKSFSNHIRAT